jgi:hypothetical protein
MIRLCVAIAPGFVDEQQHPAGKIRIVRDHRAAFACRDVLALLETYL